MRFHLRQDQALAPASFAVAFTLLSLVLRQYIFPESSHGQELPPILALLDPSLFPRDYAVQSFLEPTPRLFYQHLIAGLTRATGAAPQSVIFFLLIAAKLSFFAGIFALGRLAFSRLAPAASPRAEGAALVALGFLCSAPLPSWGSALMLGTGVPSDLAIALGIWTPVLLARGRPVAGFALAGAAIFAQFLVGLFAGLALAPALAMHALRGGGARLREGALAAALWLAPAVLIWGMMQAGARPPAAPLDFVDIFGRLRVPHHWLPSWGDKLHWASDAGLVIAALLAARILLRAGGPEAAARRAMTLGLLGMLGTAVAGVLLNLVFVEWIPVELIGKLQFQRLMPFGHLGAFLLLGGAVLQARAGAAGGAAPDAAPSGAGRDLRLVAIAAAPTLAGAALGSARALIGALVALSLWALLRRRAAALRWAPAAALALGWAAISAPEARIFPNGALLSKPLFSWVETPEPAPAPGAEISLRLRADTPRDALVIQTPVWGPLLADVLALNSRRSVFFSFKNIPYTDHGVDEWRRRLGVLLGVEASGALSFEQIKEIWRARSWQDLSAVAAEVGACRLVDHTEGREDFPPPQITAIAHGAEWGIWIFPGCPGGPPTGG